MKPNLGELYTILANSLEFTYAYGCLESRFAPASLGRKRVDIGSDFCCARPNALRRRSTCLTGFVHTGGFGCNLFKQDRYAESGRTEIAMLAPTSGRQVGLAGISHIGSLQAQRAIQTRWWHHSQVLQGQSIAGLSNKGCDSRREPCFLSVFVVFRSPASGVKAH